MDRGDLYYLFDDDDIGGVYDWVAYGDRIPKVGQKVIYFYRYVGIYRGVFTIEDGDPTFGGSHGSLGAEGCYWMSDGDDDLSELQPPEEELMDV